MFMIGATLTKHEIMLETKNSNCWSNDLALCTREVFEKEDKENSTDCATAQVLQNLYIGFLF